MPIYERPFESLDQLYETELEHLRLMFEEGCTIAAPAAVHLCCRHQRPTPDWAVIASSTLTCALMNGTPKRRGRSAGIVSRQRQDMIDYDRWCAVGEIRENREFFRNEIVTLAKLKGPKARAIRLLVEKKLAELGNGDLDAFEYASTMLKGTASKGGPDAIKKSYLKVKKAGDCGSKRYHLIDPEFVRIVGAAL